MTSSPDGSFITPWANSRRCTRGRPRYSGETRGGGGVVRRNCFYLAEMHADNGIAHVTVTDTPLGKEESMRYVNKDGELVLRRTFSPSSCGTESRVVSTEIFTKC